MKRLIVLGFGLVLAGVLTGLPAHPLLQFPVWYGRRLRPRWLRRPGGVELRPCLFELRCLLTPRG